MLACIIMIYGSSINSDIPCIQNLYFNNTSQKIFKPFSVNLISISFTNCISLPVYIHAYEIKSACFLERFLSLNTSHHRKIFTISLKICPVSFEFFSIHLPSQKCIYVKGITRRCRYQEPLLTYSLAVLYPLMSYDYRHIRSSKLGILFPCAGRR